MDQLIGVIKPLLAELTEATIPADVAKLVEQRIAARDQGDFSKADSLRQQINAAGYEVEDTSTGPRVYKVK